MDVPRYVLVHSPLVGPTIWEPVAKAATGSGVGSAGDLYRRRRHLRRFGACDGGVTTRENALRITSQVPGSSFLDRQTGIVSNPFTSGGGQVMTSRSALRRSPQA